MAFERYPQEAIDKFNETGQVFTLERQKLVPGWYKSMKTAFDKDAQNEEPETEVFLPSRMTQMLSGLHTAPSLLNLSIDFVGGHIEDVESLVDFPEIVGKGLFETATEKGVFNSASSERALRAMGLFTQAYGTLMLESANLERSSMHIESLLPAMSSMFYNIHELNLSGCRLGGNEMLLRCISHFTRLQRLNLQHNGLTDPCLQIISAPVRVLQKGPKHLEILDLSRNPLLTGQCVRYLLAFRDMKAVDLSGSQIMSRGIQKLEDTLCLWEDPETEEFSATYQYETWGWAAAVVRDWVEQAQKASVTVVESKNTTKAFYGASQYQMSRYVAHRQPNANTAPPPVEPVIRLVKSATQSALPNITTKLDNQKNVETSLISKSHLSIMPGTCLQEAAANTPTSYNMHKEIDFSLDKHVLDTYTKSPEEKRVPHKRLLLSEALETYDELNSPMEPSEKCTASVTIKGSTESEVSQPKKKRKIVLIKNKTNVAPATLPKEKSPKCQVNRGKSKSVIQTQAAGLFAAIDW